MLQMTFLTILLILKEVHGIAVIGDDTIDHHIETITNYQDKIIVRSKRSENAGKKMK